TRFPSFTRGFLPWLGVSELEKTLVNISATIESTENQTIHALLAIQEKLASLSQVVMQNWMVLNLFSASQRGVYTVINTSCCASIDQSGRVSTDMH
ncbi:ERVV2 protein, partial [Columbina picui]|nr:ERVV2 protein [Columbina picui]